MIRLVGAEEKAYWVAFAKAALLVQAADPLTQAEVDMAASEAADHADALILEFRKRVTSTSGPAT